MFEKWKLTNTNVGMKRLPKSHETLILMMVTIPSHKLFNYQCKTLMCPNYGPLFSHWHMISCSPHVFLSHVIISFASFICSLFRLKGWVGERVWEQTFLIFLISLIGILLLPKNGCNLQANENSFLLFATHKGNVPVPPKTKISLAYYFWKHTGLILLARALHSWIAIVI